MVSAVLLLGLGASIWTGCLAQGEIYNNGTNTTPAEVESETASAEVAYKGGGDDKNCHPQTVTVPVCGKRCCEDYPHCPSPVTITLPASTYTTIVTNISTVTEYQTDMTVEQHTWTQTDEHTSTQTNEHTQTDSYATTSYYTYSTSYPYTITVSKCTPSPPPSTYVPVKRHNDHEVCIISTQISWRTTTYTTLETTTAVSTETSVSTSVETSLSTETTISSTTATETSTTISSTTATETSTTISSTTATETTVSISVSLTTIVSTLPASTVTLSGEVTTIPGQITTITQTIVSTDISLSLSTAISTSVTQLPGQITSLPGEVTTVISIVPPITTTITQAGITTTSVIPASTITIVQTVTQSGPPPPPPVTETATVTATTCAVPSESAGPAPVFNPASDLTWGCRPGFVCSPPKPPGCTIWADSPADSYSCHPSECISAPAFPIVVWPENETSYYPPTEGYFNLAPPAFGLSYDIFDEDVIVTKVEHHLTTLTTGNWESQTSLSHFEATTPAPAPTGSYRKRAEIPKELLAKKLLKRDDTIIPAVCYDICNDCYVEAQSTGKTPGLCADGSAFRSYYDACQECVGANTAQGKLTTKEYLVTKFSQFLTYCDAVPAVPVETSPAPPPPQSVETTPPAVQTTPQAPPATSRPPVPITPPSDTSTSAAEPVSPTPPPSSTTAAPAATTSPVTALASRKRASSFVALVLPLLSLLLFT